MMKRLFETIFSSGWWRMKTPPWVVKWATYIVVFIVMYNLSPWGVIINRTYSVPEGVYVCDFMDERHEKGDIVLFPYECGDDCPFKGKFSGGDGVRFLKKVLALPGDRVCRIGDFAFVDGEGIKQKLYPQKVPPFLKDGECREVPEGAFYLGTQIDKGFDSRYFGFVPKDRVQAECRNVAEF